MAKLLVTGASGYIGSYLSQWLAQRGHEVTATTRRGTPELQGILQDCEVRSLDVLRIPESFAGQWDAIVHTATANDILSRDFRAGVELSSLGTRQVVDLAQRVEVPHVVFFSTLQVYGAELTGQIGEETIPSPVNDYGMNHVFGEMVCQLASRTGLRTSILRPANVYGCPVSPTVERSTLVPMCLVKEALATGHITLRSSGQQRRDFISLRQVAEACETVISRPGQKATTYNIATQETWRIVDVASWVIEAFAEVGLTKPTLKILSEEPACGNEFRAVSSITPPPLQGSVEHEMRGEIVKMIEYYRNTTAK